MGTAGLLVSASVTLAVGHNALGPLFLLGLLAALVGQVAFGAALVRHAALSCWGGVALILGLPASVLLSGFGGGVVLGLSWLVLGYVLWTAGERAAVPA